MGALGISESWQSQSAVACTKCLLWMASRRSQVGMSSSVGAVYRRVEDEVEIRIQGRTTGLAGGASMGKK